MIFDLSGNEGQQTIGVEEALEGRAREVRFDEVDVRLAGELDLEAGM